MPNVKNRDSNAGTTRSRYDRGMSDEPKKRRSRKWSWIALALLTALVLYPLSIGPAYLWAAKAIDPATAVNLCNTMYAPLIWVGGQSQWAQNAMDWYQGFWTRENWDALWPD